MRSPFAVFFSAFLIIVILYFIYTGYRQGVPGHRFTGRLVGGVVVAVLFFPGLINLFTDSIKPSAVHSEQVKDDDDTSSSSDTSSRSSIKGFKSDMNTYLDNKYPDVTMKYDDGTATFTVPDDVADRSKSSMRNYIKPINDRIETFASANDMDSEPTLLVQTSDGTALARSTITGGFKVYEQK